MRKRVLLLVAGALILGSVVVLILWNLDESPEIRLSDGRMFRIEAVTFGTNHVVGRSDWWLFPLRKVLPGRVIQFLSPTRGRSLINTDRPALVVWVHAYDPSKGQYVDCQGVTAAFVDEHGDIYPANGTGHGSFGGPANFNRQNHIFNVFPRRPKRLRLRLAPWNSDRASFLEFANPAVQAQDAVWTPEPLPASHRVGDLEVDLQELTIKTNGGPTRSWEPTSRHWQPVFKLSHDGRPATDWESPEWVAEDASGNRGQTLGLHEPVLKFIATVRPKPEAVSDSTRRWQLPAASIQTIGKGLQWNTNRVMGDLSITVIGLFPPGAYTFSEGQLTNPPGPVMANLGWTGMSKQVGLGRYQHWSTHTTTNYVAYIRQVVQNREQRIAVSLHDDQGRKIWGQSTVSEGRNGIDGFVFDLQAGAQEATLEIILLEPVQTEFLVKPTIVEPTENSKRAE